MKKLVAVLASLLLGNVALACNMDVENCVDYLTPTIMKYNGELKNTPAFMNDENARNAWQQRTDAFKQKVDMCSTQKCVNQKFLDYHNYVVNLAKKYIYEVPKQAKAQPAVNDKWADQCVVAARPNVVAYSDMSTSSKVGNVSEYNAYKVSRTSGQYVGLVNAENGKFVGWAKKAELQMQDLRNCN